MGDNDWVLLLFHHQGLPDKMCDVFLVKTDHRPFFPDEQ